MKHILWRENCLQMVEELLENYEILGKYDELLENIR